MKREEQRGLALLWNQHGCEPLLQLLLPCLQAQHLVLYTFTEGAPTVGAIGPQLALRLLFPCSQTVTLVLETRTVCPCRHLLLPLLLPLSHLEGNGAVLPVYRREVRRHH